MKFKVLIQTVFNDAHLRAKLILQLRVTWLLRNRASAWSLPSVHSQETASSSSVQQCEEKARRGQRVITFIWEGHAVIKLQLLPLCFEKNRLCNVDLFQNICSNTPSVLFCLQARNWPLHAHTHTHTHLHPAYSSQLDTTEEGFMYSQPFLPPLFLCKCLPVGQCIEALVYGNKWKGCR